MDRSKPIGNSEGTDDRGRLHVKIANKGTEPIPVSLTDIETGNSIHQYNQIATDPGNDVTILTTSVPAGKTWAVSNVDVTCRIEGVGYLKIAGITVGSFRTGAAKPRDKIEFNPRIQADAGDSIEVVFKARTGSPITDVESLFQALES
jgi:hypothetical protein